MKLIRFTPDEFEYLCSASFLDSKWKQLLHITEGDSHRPREISLPEDKADDLRDIFTEQLQVSGFNEQYELTSDGIILESLIDKFFCD